MAKKYLQGAVNVDFQPTYKETKENQTEVHLAQTYKNYKVYGQDLIVKVDKNGVITTVSGKVVQNLDQQPNLTITNFLSKNEVKSTLHPTLQIPSDAAETKFPGETVVYPVICGQ
ncbi:bacillolysin [Bacillus cereus]|nr:bacillolysin [Bacillus cereus]